MKKTIVIVGAGKGLGNAVAKKFGENDFRVALIARNKQALESYLKEFEQNGIEAYAFAADAAEPDTLTTAFGKICEQLGTPDVLFYNVGVTSYDDANALTPKLLMERYQIDVASAYHCVKLVDTNEFKEKKGAILFTGGGLCHYPIAGFMPLSMDKAALRALAIILHNQLKESGVFVGMVTVSGTIDPATYFSPTNIAEAFWKLYEGRETCELLYTYPELKDFGKNMSAEQAAALYWSELAKLAEKK